MQQSDPVPHDFHYLSWITAARKAVLDYDVTNRPDLAEAVETIHANVGCMLTELNTDALTFTREVLWHQIWAAEDQSHPNLLRNIEVDDPHEVVRQAANGTGTIFCTYHTASYRLLPYWLGVANIPLVLIADADFVATQGAEAIDGMRRAQIALNGAEVAPFDLLIAEEPTMPRRAARHLQSGGSVILYLDGNTGVGGPEARNGNQISVSFCGQKLAARKGAAFLSHLAKAPIAAAVSSRPDWLTRQITFFDPIRPAPGTPRECYCADATKRLYAILEAQVRRCPTQWEAWLYVHKFLLEDDVFIDNFPASNGCADRQMTP